MDFRQANSLSELFYYDPSTRKGAALRKGLEEFRFLLLVSIEALNCLKEKDLERFDALVGENACQIRAIKIAIIASEDLSYLDGLIQQLVHSLQATDQVLSESINSLMQSGVSLKEVIEKNSLDVVINEDAMFCIQSFVLTEMKEDVSDESTSMTLWKQERSVPAKLQGFAPDISINFIRNFSNRIRKLLSDSSVLFVKKAALYSENEKLFRCLSENVLIHNDRSCTPMFWTYKAVLATAQKRGVPIIFHVKFTRNLNGIYHVFGEEYFFFSPCQRTGGYLKGYPNEEDLGKAACVVEGVALLQTVSKKEKNRWNMTFNSTSLFDVILSGAADHRQYPCLQPSFPICDPEFQQYQRLAVENGFSIVNPRTFFIQHVYPSLTKKAGFFENDALSKVV